MIEYFLFYIDYRKIYAIKFAIKNKMSLEAILLGELCQIVQAPQSGLNEAFVLNNQEAEMLALLIRLGRSADRVADLSGKMSCVDGKIIFPFADAAPAQRGFVFKDATPTWAFCIWNRAAVTNSVEIFLTTSTAAHAACFNIALLTVGDENSNADLKIVGGQLYAGSIFSPANFEASYAGTNVLS